MTVELPLLAVRIVLVEREQPRRVEVGDGGRVDRPLTVVEGKPPADPRLQFPSLETDTTGSDDGDR
nr:hypothetical protein [Streptomyces scabichelini]